MSIDTSKVARIFEYLLAVKNLNEKIIRNINDYELVWWEKEFPEMNGFYIGGSGTNDEAWFEVHKQDIPTVPSAPTEIKKWIVKYDDPEKIPITRDSMIIGKDEENNDIIELFEENTGRVNRFEHWLDNEWKVWAEETYQKRKIQQIYMELFTLYQRFQREGDDLELACGHGLLQWEIGGFLISRHVLVTKLELIFNAKKGIFYLVPTSKDTTMETDMLLHIDFPNATRLMQMENQVSELDFSPLEVEHLKPFLLEIVHTISPDGLYKKEKDDIIKNLKSPIISYSPALFLRNIGGRLWQQELTNVIEKIKEGFPVPETIEILTTTENSSSKESNGLDQGWGPVGEELLFPLPANKEQQLIAQKLSACSGVVIQGPPGTGKSHTIANLISHLLAHGKRVLVTSEKERALQVLKNKIPEEIRALCVSVLGGDSKSVKEIEDSVRTIAENLDTKQPEILQKNIDRLTIELKTTKRNIARIDTMINEAAERESETKKFDEFELNPLEATKWLIKFDEYSWLPDEIKPNSDIPLSAVQLERFFELLGVLTKVDIQSLSLERPSSNSLPSPSVFSQKVDEILGIEEKINQTKDFIDSWTPKDYINIDYDKWINQTNITIGKLKEFQNQNWLFTILQDCIKDSDQASYWNLFIEEVRVTLNEIQILEKDLIEHSFVISLNKSLAELKEDLLVLKEKLSANSKLGWFYKNISGRKIKYLLEEMKVNDLPIRKIEDIILIFKKIELITLKQKLVLKWNRVIDEIDGSKVEENMKRFSLYLNEKCTLIFEAANWASKMEHQHIELLDVIGKSGNPRLYDVQWFNELYYGLQALKLKKIWNESNEFFDRIYSYLSNGKDHSLLHPIWNEILLAFQQREKTAWKKCFTEIVRLEGMEVDFKQFLELKGLLYEVVPKWTLQLIEDGGIGIPLFPPSDLNNAWLWNQVDYWMKDIQAKPKIEQLEDERKLEKIKEQKIVIDLVAESTWKEQIIRTTGSQKRSLFAWLKAVQRIGKGTGKYTNVYRKDASKEMKEAKGAIPVWIMPIQRVIENFELTEDLFDVIIIDESSQSNLFSLSTLLRAKKAIIVGDENQISPESVGTEISDIHELIERYLYDIPNAMQFDIRTSLYDTANRVFDSKIVLKEHYRCVPEIIQFSNDLMYGGMIDPLRLPLAKDMFHPPVKAIRVDDGYRIEGTTKAINEPEAEAIVDHIAKCIEDPKYRDKTLGVISLQGHDQGRIIENLLREKIGEEEMINRKLITGDAYAFQGDERDIIFLSMVIAPNVRFTSLGKRADLQRFNVAASRARDQMILFHSVDSNNLNPNDVRFQLLQYSKNPSRVQEELKNYEHKFDSDFERDVYSLISSRGYRVVPQVKVGTLGKRIDLVVEGLRTRLAIECDGDEWHGLDKWEDDIERQRVLERVGWIFWRVRGSAFYANPSKAMEPLWVKLKEMGIEPSNPDQDCTKELSTRFIKKEIILKKAKGRNIGGILQEGTLSQQEVNRLNFDSMENKGNSEQIDLFSLELEGFHKQINLIDLLDEEPESINNYLISKGYEIIDKRPKGGGLWIVGGPELETEINELKQKGINFHFADKGSRATRHKPAWYSSYKG